MSGGIEDALIAAFEKDGFFTVCSVRDSMPVQRLREFRQSKTNELHCKDWAKFTPEDLETLLSDLSVAFDTSKMSVLRAAKSSGKLDHCFPKRFSLKQLRCDECRFFSAHLGSIGKCRNQTEARVESEFDSEWPWVFENDVCSEWAIRQPIEAPAQPQSLKWWVKRKLGVAA